MNAALSGLDSALTASPRAHAAGLRFFRPFRPSPAEGGRLHVYFDSPHLIASFQHLLLRDDRQFHPSLRRERIQRKLIAEDAEAEQ